MNSPPTLSLPLLAVGLAAFFTMGLIQAMYGPAFPLFQERYGVLTAGVGVIASAHFLGSAAAPPFMGLALRRLSVRAAVSFSLLVLALGVSGVAFAPSWPLAVGGAFLGGLGLGGASAGLNSAYASLGHRAVNVVNSVFGLGSMVSPLLVARFASGESHALPFLVVAGLSAVALGVGRVWGVPDIQKQVQEEVGRPGLQFALFALLIMCYVGLEAGFGAWTVRYLSSLDIQGAALVLSGFWGGMTLGRLFTGLFGGRFSPFQLVLGGAVMVTLSAIAALSVPFTVVAHVLAGLSLGPIFGSVLSWMTRTLPATLVPFLLIAASVGGVLMPVVIGVLFAEFGSVAVPTSLAAVGALLVVLTLATRRVTQGVTGQASTSN